MRDFPCDKCSLCCRQLKTYEPAKYLDRGDGVCKHLDEKTNLCLIYENRPDFCNTKKYYEKEYKDKMTWEEFISFCKEGCNYLQKH